MLFKELPQEERACVCQFLTVLAEELHHRKC